MTQDPIVALRLTVEERELLDEIARRSNKTRTDLVRSWLSDKAEAFKLSKPASLNRPSNRPRKVTA